jgi:purine-cytosine permease-like protein
MKNKLHQLFSTSPTRFDDYTLRHVPQNFRRWSPFLVAITALGGIAYLADFSIGASIAILCGTSNAILAIILAAIIIFITGLPLAIYAAKYNLDLDLITRGCGFGFYSSILTSIIFASFTFIFFALEGSIMAQGLLVGLNIPLWLGYLLTTLIVLPLVIYGMRALSQLQLWTTPIWLLLMIVPVFAIIVHDPQFFHKFMVYKGNSHNLGLDGATIVAGAGIALALMGQIGEQIDYLRLMPKKNSQNRKPWWLAVLFAGPGWVIIGALKQVVGIFLAVFILASVAPQLVVEPVHQFIGAFNLFLPPWLALSLAVILVVISQIKINVTNAYSGSLAWTNAYTRITRHYPGRIIFVIFNLVIALILMESDMFSMLGFILGFYSNCAIAWITIVASDIVVNKYLLGLSPKTPEYRKSMLYPINPVGFISFILASGISILAFFNLFGAELAKYSPMIALGLALILPPILAIVTQGKYYLRRDNDGITTPRVIDGEFSPELIYCPSCNNHYERAYMSKLLTSGQISCSLCETIS